MVIVDPACSCASPARDDAALFLFYFVFHTHVRVFVRGVYICRYEYIDVSYNVRRVHSCPVRAYISAERPGGGGPQAGTLRGRASLEDERGAKYLKEAPDRKKVWSRC